MQAGMRATMGITVVIEMEEKEEIEIGIGDPFKPILFGGLSAEDLLSPTNS